MENHGKLVDFCDDIQSCLASFRRMFVDNVSDGGGFAEGEGCRGIQITGPEFPTTSQAALGTGTQVLPVLSVQHLAQNSGGP